MTRRHEEAETLASMARQIALLGFGPALSDALKPMLAEAIEAARRRGDDALERYREVSDA